MRSLMQLLKDKDPALSKNLVSCWDCVIYKLAMIHMPFATVLYKKVKKGVEPQFFGFRWITLLLSQEFLLPGEQLHHSDVISHYIIVMSSVIGNSLCAELMRIWDSLFADVNRFDFLLYMCCSMIVYVYGALSIAWSKISTVSTVLLQFCER